MSERMVTKKVASIGCEW